jgi:hypothetical protein
MDKPTDIHIDYLCNAPFWKFTKTDDGQFCKVCRHQIKDFTHLDTNMSVETMKQMGGETCGLFFKNQFTLDDKTQKSSVITNLILATGLTTILNVNANAQIHNDTIKTEQTVVDSLNLKTNEEQTVGKNCKTNADEHVNHDTTEKKKKHYLRLGNWYINVNGRFPFLHIRRMLRGKISSTRSVRYL